MQKNKCALCLPVSQRSMDLNPPLLFTTHVQFGFSLEKMLHSASWGGSLQGDTPRPAQKGQLRMS